MPDVQAEWIKRVLGFDAVAFSDQARGFDDLLESVNEDLGLLRSRDPTRARPIDNMIARAKALARPNPAAAMALLGGAAAALAQVTEARRADEARLSVEPGHVARMAGLLSQAKVGWDAGFAEAQRCAAAHIGEVAKRYPSQAPGFGSILASYWADLESLLSAAQGAAKDGNDTVELAPVRQMLAALRSEITADRLLVHLATNQVPVQAVLLAALVRVQELLPSGQARAKT